MKKKIVFIISLTFLLLSCNQDKNKSATETENPILKKYRNLKRNPLPYPNELKNVKLPTIDTLIKERDSILAAIKSASIESVLQTDTVKTGKIDLEKMLALNTCKIIMLEEESICGKEKNWQNVEAYDGSLGVTKQFVQERSTKVGQLQWKYNFGSDFKGTNDSEGSLMGIRWCTGTLIGKDIFITAGHCFDTDNKEYKDRLPQKDGKVISTRKMAQLMKVNFNYQYTGTTNTIRPDTIDYPVLDTLEFRHEKLDYAIILLGKDKYGMYPGDRFGFTEVAKDKPLDNDKIAIIQHPSGLPKVIATGSIKSFNSVIDYNNIDTEPGASGSGVISTTNNKIIGIHTSGGCMGFDIELGANSAIPIFLISQVSSIIKKLAK